MPLDGRMIWADTETFGLVPAESPVIELGFVITDLDLIEIDRWDILIWDTPTYDERFEYMIRNAKDIEAEAYVLNMHKQNNLWRDAQNEGWGLKEAETQMCDWLESHGIRGGQEPLCGSSIGFDSNMIEYWFPNARKRFHYRVIDVSSFKEYIAAKYPAHFADLPPADTQHRVIPDCIDTINEMKFYDKNFIGLPLEEKL